MLGSVHGSKEVSVLLEVENLMIGYRKENTKDTVVENICLHCDHREIVSVVGRSGSGKTTLLKAIAGLLPYDAGSIRVEGREIDGPSRERGLVFQHYSNFPWLTVRGNIEFGAHCGVNTSAVSIKAEVEELLDRTGLRLHQGKYPFELSGGMEQRVAIARCLAADPKVLLLDEPFGALDYITRVQMQHLLRSLLKENQQGIVLVTHDIEEAVSLSSRIYVIGGRPASILGLISVEQGSERKDLVQKICNILGLGDEAKDSLTNRRITTICRLT